MKRILTIALLLCGLQAGAQEIAGMVVDQRKEPLISAYVAVFQGGILKGGTITDYDGRYVVKPLEPGNYDVHIVYCGLDTSVTTGVPVTGGNRTTVNKGLFPGGGKTVIAYKQPLVDKDRGVGGFNRILQRGGCWDAVPDMVALTPALYQQKRGREDVNSRRCGEPDYIIEGVKAMPVPPIIPMKMKPLGNADGPTTYKLLRKEINKLPYTDINDMLSMYPGVYQRQRGGDISIYGSR
ncbi:MAG: carboxypeptidase-like regulatory domain-containing protein [Bacteroidota bacterium]